jgi:acetoin utilization deacetylase AcuC-like enzyme
LRYAWQATAGTIEQLDADVVLWRLPADTQAEDHLVQVAITDSDLATVASYRWNRRAA